jgi:hypothetical protein
VTWFDDIGDPEGPLEGTREVLVGRGQLVREHKSSPTERRFDVRDGNVVRSVLLVVKGKRGYAVFAQPEGDDATRMINSFRAN